MAGPRPSRRPRIILDQTGAFANVKRHDYHPSAKNFSPAPAATLDFGTVRGVVPQRIQCDNCSEFISKALDKWAYDNQVTLDFSRPGKPTDNPFIESFNGESLCGAVDLPQ